MPARPPSNDAIAEVLEDVATALEAQAANPYRVRAYREAGRIVRGLDRPVPDLLAEGGRKALEALPGIGQSLSATIEEIAHRGTAGILDRLLGGGAPEDLFAMVPGVGEELARRIHETLGLETLEDLEVAAHDGRLEGVSGFGPRRVRVVREVLGALLSRSARRRARRAVLPADGSAEAPPVPLLLSVDERYRRLAREERLPRIAPRRFNPEHRAWLPVLHADEGGWSFTAMFSNTATAHRLGRTDDWVVLYYEREGDEGQCTVVTETHGPHAGHRVVRGREREGSAPPGVTRPA